MYFVNQGNLQDADANPIHVVEGAQADEDHIIFLAPGDPTYTHIVQVSRIEADADGNTDDYAEFKDLVTGDTYKTQVFKYTAAGDTTNLIVDGKTYVVKFVDTDTVSVTFGDGKTVVYPALETTNGALLALTDDLTDAVTDSDINDNTAGSGGYLTVVLPTGTIYLDAYNKGGTDGDTGAYSLDGSDWKDISGSGDSIKVGNVYYVIDYDESNHDGTFNIAIDANQDSTVGAEEDPAVLLVEEEDDQKAENAILVASEYVGSDVGFEKPVFTASKTWEDVGTVSYTHLTLPTN